jgi:large subunit ribosomal protein L10
MAKKEKLARACKEKMVDEIMASFKGHPNFFVTSYMGSSVMDLEQVRRTLKTAASDYMVVKNSILNVVLDKLKLDEIKPMVDGGIGISFSGGDIVATSRVLVNFTRDHEKFRIKGAFLDGKVMTRERVAQLAALPAKDVLRAQVAGGIKAPITGFVNTLGGIIRKFVYAVDAIRAGRESKAGV